MCYATHTIPPKQSFTNTSTDNHGNNEANLECPETMGQYLNNSWVDGNVINDPHTLQTA
jgi:hypothetical protein